MSIYFAIQAAFCFSASHILIRRGLVTSNSATGTIVSIIISAVLLWLVTLFSIPLSSFNTQAIWYFIAGGIFAPAIGRLMTFISIERIGVARSVPITNTSPMFSSIMAVILVGEIWPAQNIIGTSLVILGIVILSGSQTQKSHWRKLDLIYPALASFCFASASILRKLGLLIANLPLMAATTSATTAVVVGAIMHQAQGGWRSFSLTRRSFAWFLAAGSAHTAAMLSAFYALSYGKVVVVDPLIGANPVLSLLLTTIFLRDLEVLNLRVVVGAVTTVAGSILIITL
jgi:DME family drug/metabolite transporter